MTQFLFYNVWFNVEDGTTANKSHIVKKVKFSEFQKMLRPNACVPGCVLADVRVILMHIHYFYIVYWQNINTCFWSIQSTILLVLVIREMIYYVLNLIYYFYPWNNNKRTPFIFCFVYFEWGLWMDFFLHYYFNSVCWCGVFVLLLYRNLQLLHSWCKVVKDALRAFLLVLFFAYKCVVIQNKKYFLR